MPRGLLRKGAIALAATFVIGGISAAQAETCYKLTPFTDILRLNCTTKPATGPFGSTHTLCNGNWIAPGSYTLPVVGSRELNKGSTATAQARRLGLHGTNNSGSFGGNPICIIDGIPNAPFTIVCTGGAGARFVNNGGTSLTPIACGGLAPASEDADGGKAAGD
ncbi:MAG: hypothetical protein U1E42_14160 [Rhodospirillales bacterium]